MEEYELKHCIEEIAKNENDIFTHKLTVIKDKYTLMMSFNNRDPHMPCVFSVFIDDELYISNFGKMDEILENFVNNL